MDTNLPPGSNPPPSSYGTPPPPPLISPPSAPRPRKSRGWMIVAIILFVLLGFSILFNIGSLFSSIARLDTSSTRKAGPRLEEVVVEDIQSRNKIAVISIEGIISSRLRSEGGHGLVDVLKAQLKRAEEDARVKAVLLKVDSPGGEVLASDEIYKLIAKFQDDTAKPVVASMGGLAASGGYYVSAPCRWIVAHDMTITGSIGVIISTWNFHGLMNKVGIRPYTYKSGKFKDMLSGTRNPDEIPPEEAAMLQDLIDKTYVKFRNVVQEGRARAAQENESEGRSLAADWRDYADGRILTGTEAYELGFVDQIGNFDDAVRRAQEIASVGKANLVEYRLRYDFADFFRMFGETESRTVKIDLGVEPPPIEAGRPYYLYLP